MIEILGKWNNFELTNIKYPEFYKIVITKPVADKLNLQIDLPLVEVIEVKKNKSSHKKSSKSNAW